MDWQTPLTLVIVAGSALLLARRTGLWPWGKQAAKSGCGSGCHHCPAAPSSLSTPLVSLKLNPPPKPAAGMEDKPLAP